MQGQLFPQFQNKELMLYFKFPEIPEVIALPWFHKAHPDVQYFQ